MGDDAVKQGLEDTLGLLLVVMRNLLEASRLPVLEVQCLDPCWIKAASGLPEEVRMLRLEIGVRSCEDEGSEVGRLSGGSSAGAKPLLVTRLSQNG